MDHQESDINRLQSRLQQVAGDKANLQLVLRLMERLDPLVEVDNLVQDLLNSIMDTIGGTNTKLFYWDAGELNYQDFLGQRAILPAINDPLARQVAERREFIQELASQDAGLMQDVVVPVICSWGFPLVVRDELIGIVIIENLHIGACSLGKYLPVFFNHMALVLMNELRRKARDRADEEKRRLQSQLLQAQKMEGLGTLASGVAHDMNNVLGAILGLASSQIYAHAEGSRTHQAFGTIMKACDRGGKMVKTLLSFARRNPAEERELDLNALLQEEVRLMEQSTLGKVQLRLDLAPDLWSVCGDASALTHTIMNLCVNAADAMPEGGNLTLQTRNKKGMVELLVSDSGTGMSPEILSKALDPFFTTKPQGKGTGLGLSMAYNIMRAHQGQLDIQSEPGRGTVVTLRFPPCAASAPALETPPSEKSRSDVGSLHLLLVDDDELIQSSVSSILQVLNHRVTAVTSGEEALARMEAGLQPDAVILDLNMPGLGGASTLPLLRVQRPDLPVLLATGRADQTALSLAAAFAKVTLLAKPFSLQEMKAALAGILQSRD